ncbi:MAG: WxcM-like domain-containing protein [Erysipelotrichaceae bacterium]|nr:WxcM-like domain-containing protein [Erysipelotrichaceae bacterium]
MEIKMYTFEPHGDARGQLVAVEANKDIPFEVKRVYYMYDTTYGVARGHHAHKALEQILICVHGSCKILLDNGKEKETVILDQPNKGLYISSDIWRVMYDFSPDAVLMVMASTYYDESDYIRDYDEFLKYVESRG